MAPHQAPPSLGFSRQEHWSGTLSYLPPSMQLWQCRQICWCWRPQWTPRTCGWTSCPITTPSCVPSSTLVCPPAPTPLRTTTTPGPASWAACEYRNNGCKFSRTPWAKKASVAIWCQMVAMTRRKRGKTWGVRPGASWEASYCLAYRWWYKGEM